jgi:hypothetical protein
MNENHLAPDFFNLGLQIDYQEVRSIRCFNNTPVKSRTTWGSELNWRRKLLHPI